LQKYDNRFAIVPLGIYTYRRANCHCGGKETPRCNKERAAERAAAREIDGPGTPS
jgi:hypothetical protein